MAEQIQRRLAAILSADVVGYSRLMADDDVATVQTLNAYREIVATLIQQHGGRVVDSPGDNLLAEFPSTLGAVEAAVEIQRVISARNLAVVDERRMEFRVGVHVGDVMFEGERIYGDGVNIAARLEGLAETGGICISGMVHSQVEGKLRVAYDDLGDQSIKNIPQSVRVYRVKIGAAVPPQAPRRGLLRPIAIGLGALGLALGAVLWATWPSPLGVLIGVAGLTGPPVNPPLPDVPSIVVLPFNNLSADPEQEYFSDGITEDLTTVLSQVPEGLFVISRNSAFTYKGRSVKIEEVGRELGVRYVLEGSVRKAGDRVRITAQLIDATSGFHVWSEKYDRDLADIFAVQSEISEKILGELRVEIRDAEMERIRRKPTDDLNAYDLFMRGLSHFQRTTRRDMAEATRLLERAIEIDPDYADAYGMLGTITAIPYLLGWDLDPTGIADRTEELGRRALEIDPGHAPAHATVATAYAVREDFGAVLTYAERAIELSPNFAPAHLMRGFALAASGNLISGTQSIQRALRLEPHAPPIWSSALGWMNYATGRESDAVVLWLRAIGPDMVYPRVGLATHYESIGRHDEARRLVREILEINPNLTADRMLVIFPMLTGSTGEEVVANLRAAGMS